MLDNTYWGRLSRPRRCAWAALTPDGGDLTNRLSRLFIEGGTNLALP
jgi:hypothetical protein